MGKAGRWLRSFLVSKKDKPQSEAMPEATPKEKRWSFRRPVTLGRAALPQEQIVCEHAYTDLSVSEPEFDEKKQAVAVAVATAAAADAAVAAVQAAATVIRLSSGKAQLSASLVEEAAAVRIQATFRGYLARKALCALRGIVKLQSLVRGQLVRKQANATLRCMQALVTAQYHLRAHHMRMLQEHSRPPKQRRSPLHPAARRSYEMDMSWEKNAKIVEMDVGEPPQGGAGRSRNGAATESNDRRFSEYYSWYSPVPSALTELSPRAYSGHFEELAFATAQSSPQYVSEPVAEFFPSYMANTESSRAKARSQSAPRQRADAFERQPSRRKVAEPRNVPKSAKMQRSSSHVGAAARGGLYAWSVKLDASSASLKESECGSTSSVLTANTVYSRTRSLVGFEVRGGQY